MTTQEAVSQLQRSERGRFAAKLLFAFLDSNTVKFLDGPNFFAIATLVNRYALGSGAESCEVMDSLKEMVQRNASREGA